MHNYSEEKTAKFFNEDFSPLEKRVMHNLPLRQRDYIFLESLKSLDKGIRILDFGCGQGRLLTELLKSNFDAIGIEKHHGMGNFAMQATESAGFKNRIKSGGIEILKTIPDESFDIVLMMGVLQYLSESDYAEAISESRRILKRPNGIFYATFQNALFDMFTFNKYTIDFYMTTLCGPFLEKNEAKIIENALIHLLKNPHAPEFSASRARDNIFVRLTNPLTLKEEMNHNFRLSHQKTYFYDWFGLPPLLLSEFKDISERISGNFETKLASAWQGHFMANAFLASFNFD